MHVLARADGGPDRGIGHLVRTGTVADALLERGHRLTCASVTPDHAASILPDEVVVEPLAEEASFPDFAADRDPDALLVDRPSVPLERQRRLRDAAGPLALVRDDAGGTVCCDLVINGHVYVAAGDYDWEGPEPAWCVGGDYNVMSRSLRERARRDAPWRDPPERALVTMGGSDPGGTTPVAMEALDGLDVRVDVVVGPAFDGGTIRAVDAAADRIDVRDVTSHRDPSADDLAELGFQADLAVTALGLTAYELLAMRTPLVGLPQAADQYEKARELDARDAAVVLPDDAGAAGIREAVLELVENPARRHRLRETAGGVVDPDGVERVCDRFEALVGDAPSRPARENR